MVIKCRDHCTMLLHVLPQFCYVRRRARLDLFFVMLQLTEWTKYDDKLVTAVEKNQLDKIQSLLTKKGVIPTKLDAQGYTT